ncbi:DNA cytosine methyltransferase [Micromonospora sp. CPCC 205739]
MPNLGDIRTVDWTRVEPVDVLTAGFPCQGISNAGKRAGITGPHSSLWHHVTKALRVLRPPLVFVENVAALRRRGLDVVALEGGSDALLKTVGLSDRSAARKSPRRHGLGARASRQPPASPVLQRRWWRPQAAGGSPIRGCA